jgi:hypothetical protein
MGQTLSENKPANQIAVDSISIEVLDSNGIRVTATGVMPVTGRKIATLITKSRLLHRLKLVNPGVGKWCDEQLEIVVNEVEELRQRAPDAALADEALYDAWARGELPDEMLDAGDDRVTSGQFFYLRAKVGGEWISFVRRLNAIMKENDIKSKPLPVTSLQEISPDDFDQEYAAVRAFIPKETATAVLRVLSKKKRS